MIRLKSDNSNINHIHDIELTQVLSSLLTDSRCWINIGLERRLGLVNDCIKSIKE